MTTPETAREKYIGDGDSTDEMTSAADQRYEERYIPAWVVAEAVGRAIGADVNGIESRSVDEYAVLIDTEVSEE